MKFGCLAVDCLDDLEIKELCDFLLKNGYFRFGRNEGYSLIAIDIDGTFYDLPSSDIVSKERKRITYQQFMEKYAMSDLKSKVEEAKKALHLNTSKLSIKMGFSETYLRMSLSRNIKQETKGNIIAKLESLIEQSKKELTHDFQGKALNKHIEDAMMISKSEYESMKKEIDHKTQIAEKHADMRNKAELRVSELEKEFNDKDIAIKQLMLNSGNQVLKINELESRVQSLQEKLIQSEQDSEKWQCDYWTVSRENIDLTNDKRSMGIWLAISILTIVVMVAYGVLHFNWVV